VRRSRQAWNRAVVAVLLAAVPAACGLPTEDVPRVIDPDRVPFDLGGAAQRDAPTFDERLELRPITVYLVEAGSGGRRRLVARQRAIPDPVNLATVVGHLMAGGVTPVERAEGLINQVPGLELRSVERTEAINRRADDAGAAAGIVTERIGPTATIDVAAEFFDRFPTAEAQRLAIGQIVLTVTGYKPASGAQSVERVRFTVAGKPRFVLTGDPDTPILDVVTAADYASLQGTAATVEGSGSGTIIGGAGSQSSTMLRG